MFRELDFSLGRPRSAGKSSRAMKLYHGNVDATVAKDYVSADEEFKDLSEAFVMPVALPTP